ncbi:MAG: RagB/SusD family nutrient uptake outer membrane protein [Saprospiraceae bacterium]|nr:RagB/SusD family nutrient uptake outer membrane protein [Saprospiraceae bacterium]MDP4810942.1 RagB/SusD family nutrient uptake outer membrane protein [Saprospiraceae bacterium]MDP4915898.1 RagB/SusD family nutrient uptake outer membrane protein [Saprospiraceae bacterium]MDP5089897.1 RagB/SusD family nutrient uptake outer membrane protein [Saprospiraceae bacterium]
MKNILSFFFFILFTSSCEEGFLDLSPESQPNVNDFYKTPGDILNGVNAAYASLQSGALYGGRDFMDMTEYRGDNTFDNDPSANSGLRYNVDRFLAGSDNTIFENVWRRLYLNIYRCNMVLDNIPNVTMNSTLSKQYQGEVQFIRALSYFHLVQLWGPVPLVLKVQTTEESRLNIRNSVNEVYAAIENDLKLAATNLPKSYAAIDLGRVTSGAAKGLLGKVYLTQKKYNDAITVLREVINSGDFVLMPTVADVFDPKKEYNKEILFAVRFSLVNNSESHGLYYSSQIGDFVDPNLRSLYSSTDTRKAMLDLRKPIGTQNQTALKFFEEPTNNVVGTDFPVLRYADVLLMYAEALNEVGYQSSGDALTSLNTVRTRAGAIPYTSAELSNQATFREAILLERRMELPLELHRWYDLIRTGKAKDALKTVGVNIQDFNLLFPIPNSQVQIYNNPTGFSQNQGY